MTALARYSYAFLIFIFLFSGSPLQGALSEKEAEAKLKKIHSKLTLLHGSLLEEYPEQLMAAMYISKNDKILELGGNVGRNSCVISSLLNDSQNLVVVESDPVSVLKLTENRNHNHLLFQIEDSAISTVPLLQSGWLTIPSNVPIPGYYPVKIISYHDLKNKYGINFNTLVADCEGALYYILRDDESVLDDVDTIIVENDYMDKTHFEDVSAKFISHGFHLVYNKMGGWGPCYYEFYQVWQKI